MPRTDTVNVIMSGPCSPSRERTESGQVGKVAR